MFMIDYSDMKTRSPDSKLATTSVKHLQSADKGLIYFRLAGRAPMARGRGLTVRNEHTR